jgi:hypothetical protein
MGVSYNAVKYLVELGILVQTDSSKRNRVFAYGAI